MSKRKSLAVLFALLPVLMLPACRDGQESKPQDETSAPAKAVTTQPADSAKTDLTEDVVAKVNGVPITMRQVKLYVRQRQQIQKFEDTPQQRKQIIDEVINFEVMVQAAEALELDKQETIAAEIEHQRRNVLMTALLQEHVRNNPLTDEALRKHYESSMEGVTFTQYQISHILLETEEQAKDMITRLQAGVDFAELATHNSKDISRNQGGDIGWVAKAAIPDALLKAVESLKDGEYTATPVKSKFGWHVVKRTGQRESPAPDFEEVKSRVRASREKARLEEFMVTQREAAKVEVLYTEPEPESEIQSLSAPFADYTSKDRPQLPMPFKPRAPEPATAPDASTP